MSESAPEDESTNKLRADALALKLKLAELELEMIRKGSLSEDTLASVIETRKKLRDRDERLDALDQSEPSLSLGTVRRIALGLPSIAFFCVSTFVVLAVFGQSRLSHAKPDYYVAVATLLPVLFVAGFVQTTPMEFRLTPLMVLAQFAPLISGEIIALYVLAKGRGTPLMLGQTVLSAVSAVTWMFVAFWIASDYETGLRRLRRATNTL